MATPHASAAGQRPLRADAQRNYQRLLDEARAAFAEHGPDASLDDIARRAGVASGTLYRHFPTRKSLIEAVLRERVEALARLGHDLPDQLDPLAALTTWLRAVRKHAATYRGLSAELMTTALDESSDVIATWHRQMFDVGAGLLARGQDTGVVRADANSTDVLKLVSAIAWATEGAPDREAQADRLLELLLDGLRAAPRL